jgi:molybdate transport system substrate-binding protein
MHVERFLQVMLSILLVSACTIAIGRQAAPGLKQEGEQEALTVFAAASLSEAFSEIGAAFEAENLGVKVSFNFAGSQQLAQQIALEAPADVFASANLAQMQAAVQAGRVDESQIQPFVHNRLVVLLPKDNPAQLAGLQDLAKPGIKLVLSDSAVPAGQYSLEFLEKAAQDPAYGADFKQKVLNNVVSYEENVRSVLSKVILGEADAGIIYQSDVAAASLDEVIQIDIPDRLNVIASYYIAPLTDTSRSKLADAFIAAILSPASQQILAKCGLMPIQ